MTSEVFFDLDPFDDVCAQQLFEPLGDHRLRAIGFPVPGDIARAHTQNSIADPRRRRRARHGRARRNLPRERHLGRRDRLIVEQGLKRPGGCGAKGFHRANQYHSN